MKWMILSLCHFFHLLATVVWVGGITMILLVILPGAKASLDAGAMGKFMKYVTLRFTPLANLSIIVLILTGATMAFLKESAGWNVAMSIKYLLAAAMISIHFYRGWILTPTIAKLSAQGNDPQRVAKLQSFSLNLVKTNFALGLLIILLSAGAAAR